MRGYSISATFRVALMLRAETWVAAVEARKGKTKGGSKGAVKSNARFFQPKGEGPNANSLA